MNIFIFNFIFIFNYICIYSLFWSIKIQNYRGLYIVGLHIYYCSTNVVYIDINICNEIYVCDMPLDTYISKPCLCIISCTYIPILVYNLYQIDKILILILQPYHDNIRIYATWLCAARAFWGSSSAPMWFFLHNSPSSSALTHTIL